MATRKHGATARLTLSIAAAAALSGCVWYGPPYAAYDPGPVAAPYYYPYAYGRPAYVGPPVSLNFGYYGYRGGGGYRGHGWGGGRGGYGGGWRGRR